MFNVGEVMVGAAGAVGAEDAVGASGAVVAVPVAVAAVEGTFVFCAVRVELVAEAVLVRSAV